MLSKTFVAKVKNIRETSKSSCYADLDVTRVIGEFQPSHGDGTSHAAPALDVNPAHVTHESTALAVSALLEWDIPHICGTIVCDIKVEEVGKVDVTVIDLWSRS
jgi:hypothetical protein